MKLTIALCFLPYLLFSCISDTYFPVFILLLQLRCVKFYYTTSKNNCRFTMYSEPAVFSMQVSVGLTENPGYDAGCLPQYLLCPKNAPHYFVTFSVKVLVTTVPELSLTLTIMS